MISGPDRVDQPRGLDAPRRERRGGGDLPGLGCFPQGLAKGQEAKKKNKKRVGVAWCMVYGVVSLGLFRPPHSFLGSWRRLVPGEPTGARRAADAGGHHHRGVLCGGEISFEGFSLFRATLSSSSTMGNPQDMSLSFAFKPSATMLRVWVCGISAVRVCAMKGRDGDGRNLTISCSFSFFMPPPKAPYLFFPTLVPEPPLVPPFIPRGILRLGAEKEGEGEEER